MARVTVEDCLERIPNRFELVIAAVDRARKLELGSVQPLVEWEKDKPTVVALREIAEGKIGPGVIEQVATFDADVEEEVVFNAEDAGGTGEAF